MDMLLFDLDNTLYSPERELFSLIDVRINRYMCQTVGIPPAEVDGLRRRYWAEYGVTLQGLIRHYQVDPEVGVQGSMPNRTKVWPLDQLTAMFTVLALYGHDQGQIRV